MRRHFSNRFFLLCVCVFPFVFEADGSHADGCDTNAVDKCFRGILFSAENNRSFFWKEVEAVEDLCDRVLQIPQCVKNATVNCPEGGQRFLKALMKSYEVVMQSELCAKTAEGGLRRESFAKSSSCLREKFDNKCMINYISSLEALVNATDQDKVRKACCLHRAYRVCLADSITPLCGVEAASGYIQFNSMLSFAPIREICVASYADDSCVDSGWKRTTEVSNIEGTILSRLLQILISTSEVEQPPVNDFLDEALEYTTCTGESIDQCFFGLLPLTTANSSSPWSNDAQMAAFCSRLSAAPRCLRSRTQLCHTPTNEFVRLVKKEIELMTRESFCQKKTEPDQFFIEGGRCFSENVNNDCSRNLVLALEAAVKAASQTRRKLMCCMSSRYSECLLDALKPKCGVATAEFFSSLLRRLALPGQAACECELEVSAKPLHTGTSMRSLVHMLEEP